MKGEGVHAGHLARCSTLWKACLNMCLALIRESLRIVIISKNQVVFMIYDAICTVKQSKLSRYTAMCGEGCLERGGGCLEFKFGMFSNAFILLLHIYREN